MPGKAVQRLRSASQSRLVRRRLLEELPWSDSYVRSARRAGGAACKSGKLLLQVDVQMHGYHVGCIRVHTGDYLPALASAFVQQHRLQGCMSCQLEQMLKQALESRLRELV
eukprot:TRINITY_DN13082_c0_g1_i2.p2 TRINITY_DN13082_c0_g1~~TRINITY_DN13082_c0_g1_i2.p2  ORF type:complete len:111 (+),score=29.37 TRINITY_DN13082_c0_g1_i2:377-709(+)